MERGEVRALAGGPWLRSAAGPEAAVAGPARPSHPAAASRHVTCAPPPPSSHPPRGRRHWGLGLDRRCVYELDSSTPAKFSRHLTVRLPGHAFATNHAMGKFVAQVRGPGWG